MPPFVPGLEPHLVLAAGFSHQVVTAHNGCLQLAVTVQGRAAHAAITETDIDALLATKILTALDAQNVLYQQVHSGSARGTNARGDLDLFGISVWSVVGHCRDSPVQAEAATSFHFTDSRPQWDVEPAGIGNDEWRIDARPLRRRTQPAKQGLRFTEQRLDSKMLVGSSIHGQQHLLALQAL